MSPVLNDVGSRTTVLDPNERERTLLAALYERDETEWLERSLALAAAGRHNELDLVNLSEYLESMSGSKRESVTSRLEVLMMHLLKWEHQQERRSGSWGRTIKEQKRKLGKLLRSGALRRFAEEELADCFAHARASAVIDTGLPLETFPQGCPWTLDELLAELDEG